MSKNLSAVMGILFLFVFTFSLVVTTANQAEAGEVICCIVSYDWCEGSPPNSIAPGRWYPGQGCVLEQETPARCGPMPICLD